MVNDITSSMCYLVFSVIMLCHVLLTIPSYVAEAFES